MKHYMNLHNEPFLLIKEGTKTIEMRLNDEKRQLLNVGDTLEFTNRLTNEKINTTIEALEKYESFEELYKHYDKVSIGYKETEEANPKDMEIYYPEEEQAKYGVVAIKIKVNV